MSVSTGRQGKIISPLKEQKKMQLNRLKTKMELLQRNN